ncbi:hypothetical protein BJ508DRAFT_336049 [Ascobolus immersus RN42]|uniref:Uncharacterized protein n=1 Tax=Ascobolus immersus RN42 TaxID=1160509 RepID=A0A3N4H9Y9_ASCIM|nr:hypothetical protein BJ508DRAFT_336049 [Ascobolus immersus RN42]
MSIAYPGFDLRSCIKGQATPTRRIHNSTLSSSLRFNMSQSRRGPGRPVGTTKENGYGLKRAADDGNLSGTDDVPASTPAAKKAKKGTPKTVPGKRNTHANPGNTAEEASVGDELDNLSLLGDENIIESDSDADLPNHTNSAATSTQAPRDPKKKVVGTTPSRAVSRGPPQSSQLQRETSNPSTGEFNITITNKQMEAAPGFVASKLRSRVSVSVNQLSLDYAMHNVESIAEWKARVTMLMGELFLFYKVLSPDDRRGIFDRIFPAKWSGNDKVVSGCIRFLRDCQGTYLASYRNKVMAYVSWWRNSEAGKQYREYLKAKEAQAGFAGSKFIEKPQVKHLLRWDHEGSSFVGIKLTMFHAIDIFDFVLPMLEPSPEMWPGLNIPADRQCCRIYGNGIKRKVFYPVVFGNQKVTIENVSHQYTQEALLQPPIKKAGSITEQFQAYGNGSEEFKFTRVDAGPARVYEPKVLPATTDTGTEAGAAANEYDSEYEDYDPDTEYLATYPLPPNAEVTDNTVLESNPELITKIEADAKDDVNAVLSAVYYTMDKQGLPYNPDHIKRSLMHLLYSVSSPRDSGPSQLALEWQHGSIFHRYGIMEAVQLQHEKVFNILVKGVRKLNNKLRKLLETIKKTNTNARASLQQLRAQHEERRLLSHQIDAEEKARQDMEAEARGLGEHQLSDEDSSSDREDPNDNIKSPAEQSGGGFFGRSSFGGFKDLD